MLPSSEGQSFRGSPSHEGRDSHDGGAWRHVTMTWLAGGLRSCCTEFAPAQVCSGGKGGHPMAGAGRLVLQKRGCLLSGEGGQWQGLHSPLSLDGTHRAISAICPQPIIQPPSCTALIVGRADYRVERDDWQVPRGPAVLVAKTGCT